MAVLAASAEEELPVDRDALLQEAFELAEAWLPPEHPVFKFVVSSCGPAGIGPESPPGGGGRAPLADASAKALLEGAAGKEPAVPPLGGEAARPAWRHAGRAAPRRPQTAPQAPRDPAAPTRHAPAPSPPRGGPRPFPPMARKRPHSSPAGRTAPARTPLRQVADEVKSVSELFGEYRKQRNRAPMANDWGAPLSDDAVLAEDRQKLEHVGRMHQMTGSPLPPWVAKEEVRLLYSNYGHSGNGADHVGEDLKGLTNQLRLSSQALLAAMPQKPQPAEPQGGANSLEWDENTSKWVIVRAAKRSMDAFRTGLKAELRASIEKAKEG